MSRALAPLRLALLLSMTLLAGCVVETRHGADRPVYKHAPYFRDHGHRWHDHRGGFRSHPDWRRRWW